MTHRTAMRACALVLLVSGCSSANDAGTNAGDDAGTDGGTDVSAPVEAGEPTLDASGDSPRAPVPDAGLEASGDASSSKDAGVDSGSAGSKFKPLQHFSMESFKVGAQPIVSGGVSGNDQLNGWYGNGYGGIVVNSQHRPAKTRSLSLSIQAGTSGFPGDGETPSGNGLWGFFLYPPSSQGTSLPHGYYGGQGDIWHQGMWIMIPAGTLMGTPTITDGSLKWQMNCFPDFGTTGKDVTMLAGHHSAGDGNFSGFTLANEFDPHDNVDNSYPSTRSTADDNASLPIDGKWHWLETAVLLDGNGAASCRRVWVDDVLILQRGASVVTWRDTSGAYHTQTISGSPGVPTLPNSSAMLESMTFMTYWNGHPSVDTTIYVDDIMTSVDEGSMIYKDTFNNPIMGSASN